MSPSTRQRDYRETGQTNDLLKWEQRSAQLEKFLPHGGFQAQAH